MKKILSVLCVLALVASFAVIDTSANNPVRFNLVADPMDVGDTEFTVTLQATLPAGSDDSSTVTGFHAYINYPSELTLASSPKRIINTGISTYSQYTDCNPYQILWVSGWDTIPTGTTTALFILTFKCPTADVGDSYNIHLSFRSDDMPSTANGNIHDNAVTTGCTVTVKKPAVTTTKPITTTTPKAPVTTTTPRAPATTTTPKAPATTTSPKAPATTTTPKVPATTTTPRVPATTTIAPEAPTTTTTTPEVPETIATTSEEEPETTITAPRVPATPITTPRGMDVIKDQLQDSKIETTRPNKAPLTTEGIVIKVIIIVAIILIILLAIVIPVVIIVVIILVIVKSKKKKKSTDKKVEEKADENKE